jgi:hypothetical protein
MFPMIEVCTVWIINDWNYTLLRRQHSQARLEYGWFHHPLLLMLECQYCHHNYHRWYHHYYHLCYGHHLSSVYVIWCDHHDDYP